MARAKSEFLILRNSDLGVLAGQITYHWLPGGGFPGIYLWVWPAKTSKSEFPVLRNSDLGALAAQPSPLTSGCREVDFQGFIESGQPTPLNQNFLC